MTLHVNVHTPVSKRKEFKLTQVHVYSLAPTCGEKLKKKNAYKLKKNTKYSAKLSEALEIKWWTSRKKLLYSQHMLRLVYCLRMTYLKPLHQSLWWKGVQTHEERPPVLHFGYTCNYANDKFTTHRRNSMCHLYAKPWTWITKSTTGLMITKQS